MKIRGGFVSNSSNSSFILIYLPENFDPEVYLDYINEKNKKNIFPSSVVGDLRKLMKSEYINEQDDVNDYYQLYDAVYELKIYYGETTEEQGYIQIINKSFFDKRDKIEAEYNPDIMKQATIAVREKREKMKLKYKHIDPYGEEEWEEKDEDVKEELKIKTLYDFVKESCKNR